MDSSLCRASDLARYRFETFTQEIKSACLATQMDYVALNTSSHLDIALSTYLPLGDTLDAEKTEAALKTPIFQAHGTYDPIVAYQLGEMTRDLLQSSGVQVTYKTYPMEHSLHYEEIDAIKSWLGNIVK